jgi:hypothetical protein
MKIKGISPVADHWRTKAEELERSLARQSALLREARGTLEWTKKRLSLKGIATNEIELMIPERLNALCDAALQAEAMRETSDYAQRKLTRAHEQIEAMREAIVLNVGRMRNDMKLRGYLSVGTLTSALDDLSQSLNPKNEEGK